MNSPNSYSTLGSVERSGTTRASALGRPSLGLPRLSDTPRLVPPGTCRRSTSTSPSRTSSSTLSLEFCFRPEFLSPRNSLSRRTSRCASLTLPVNSAVGLLFDRLLDLLQYIAAQYKKLKPRPGMGEMMQILRDGGFEVLPSLPPSCHLRPSR